MSFFVPGTSFLQDGAILARAPARRIFFDRPPARRLLIYAARLALRSPQVEAAVDSSLAARSARWPPRWKFSTRWRSFEPSKILVFRRPLPSPWSSPVHRRNWLKTKDASAWMKACRRNRVNRREFESAAHIRPVLRAHRNGVVNSQLAVLLGRSPRADLRDLGAWCRSRGGDAPPSDRPRRWGVSSSSNLASGPRRPGLTSRRSTRSRTTFSIGVPENAGAYRRGASSRARRGRQRVLDVLRLVQDDVAPVDLREQLFVAAQGA